MLRLILFFVFTLSLLPASEKILQISSDFQNASALGHLEFIADVNDSFNAQAIYKHTSLTHATKSTLGNKSDFFWTRLKVQNLNTKAQTLLFSNPRSGIDFIDVYIFKEGILEQRFSLGDIRPMSKRAQKHPNSNFKLKIDSGVTYTIVTRLYCYGTLDINWIIDSYSSYIQTNIFQSLIIGLFAGAFLILIMYNLFLYLVFQERLYLLYIGYLASGIAIQLSILGFIYYFFSQIIDLKTITIFSWNLMHLHLLFFYWMIIDFFDLKKHSVLLMRIFQAIVLYHLAVALYYSYAYINPNVLHSIPILSLIAIIQSVFVVGVTLYATIKKWAGALSLFIGNLLNIVFVFYYIAVLQGSADTSWLSQYSIMISIIIIAVSISFALSNRWYAIKKENEANKKLLEEQQKFYTIGATISYVSHEWKQPLSRLASSVANLYASVDLKPDSLLGQVQKALPQMQSNIQTLNQTLKDIKSLFKTSHIIEIFDLGFAINESILSLQREHDASYIKVTFTMEQRCNLLGECNLIKYALNNIMQNSIDAIYEKRMKDGEINILVKVGEKDVTISFEDNAGGIKITPIEDIFDKTITDKASGTGLGLTLAKQIIISKFKGSLSAYNSEKGAVIEVTLPIFEESKEDERC